MALPFQGGGGEAGQLASTQEYLEKEVVEAAKCQDLFLRIQKYEQIHPVSLKVRASSPNPWAACELPQPQCGAQTMPHWYPCSSVLGCTHNMRHHMIRVNVTQVQRERHVAPQQVCCSSLFNGRLLVQSLDLLVQVLHSHPGPYLAVRKQLVSLTLHYAAALQLSQETAHTALALMDRCVMSGVHLIDHLHTLLVCACLRVAAVQESAFLPSPLAIQALTNIPGALPS